MKNTTLRRLLLAAVSLTLAALCALPCFAADFPAKRASVYVYDEADVIAPEVEEDINARADALYAMTGAQIMTVVVKSTGTTPIAQYTSGLFTEWQVGSAMRQNGILLVMATEDRSYWILQGNGIKSDVTDGQLQVINNDYLEEHFAAGNYGDGAKAVFDRLLEKFETLYSVDITTWDGKYLDFNYAEGDKPTDPGSDKKEGGFSWGGFFKVVLWVLVGAAVIVLVYVLIRALRRPKYVRGSSSKSSRGSYVDLPRTTNRSVRGSARPQTRQAQGQRPQTAQSRQIPQGQRRQDADAFRSQWQYTEGRQRPAGQRPQGQYPQGQRPQYPNGQRGAGQHQPRVDRTVYPDNPPYVDRNNPNAVSRQNPAARRDMTDTRGGGRR